MRLPASPPPVPPGPPAPRAAASLVARPSDRHVIGLAPGAALEAGGQDARKYLSPGPTVARLIDRWLRRLRRVVGDAPVVVDMGIGEGLATARITGPSTLVIGLDFRHDKLALARDRLPWSLLVRADAGMLPLSQASAPVVTCIEVLEHLVAPDLAVAELSRITGDRCIFSVPWEPFFRLGNLARGKNLGRWGNDPEHVQHYSPTRLRAQLEPWFAEVRVRRCFPWLVAVGRRPRPGPPVRLP